ncbi:hypothetical protein ACI77O_13015 [Pseudomonas tritici]|uniref:hypothetical protein n=1 Tax=Pseudomonas tritici TaxID=2745518 RepID=UPI00387B1BBF
MIKLDSQYLVAELPASVIRHVLGDVVARYESFFTFGEPTYPHGQAELLFKVLADGYGLATCTHSIGVEVVDLRAVRVVANPNLDAEWKDPFVGRIMAAAFTSTL